MTDIPERTNIIPSIGIYSVFSVNTDMHEINPPSASEPVSPINIAALFPLKRKNAAMAPTAKKHRTA